MSFLLWHKNGGHLLLCLVYVQGLELLYSVTSFRKFYDSIWPPEVFSTIVYIRYQGGIFLHTLY